MPPAATDPPTPPMLVAPALPAVVPLAPAVGMLDVPPEGVSSFVSGSLLQAITEAIVSPMAVSVGMGRMIRGREERRVLPAEVFAGATQILLEKTKASAFARN
jgi:hypothetical protein